jgi:carbon monoxide dehydrogenase subunit G
MLLSDSFTVNAPLDEVWRFMFDIERMGPCVPGVESIEVVDETTYRGVLKIKVGPIGASFRGQVTLREVEAPRRVSALVEGDDKSVASAVKATFTVQLAEIEAGTEVSYQMDVTVRGRLGQFGTTIISATAKKMTAEFAKNVRAQLEN